MPSKRKFFKFILIPKLYMKGNKKRTTKQRITPRESDLLSISGILILFDEITPILTSNTTIE
jgi:hypothetical protein